MKRKQHVQSFLVCRINVYLVHDIQEKVNQSNLQLVFLQTASLKGATCMSRYFRVLRGNV